MSASLRRVDHARHPLKGALLAGICSAALALSTGSASAQATSWTGTTSNDWTVGANWLLGTAPTAANTVNLNTTSPNPTVLGVGGPATGATGGLIIGNNTPGTFGNLTIQNGSTLTTSSTARFGLASTSGGTLTVTGPGSQWLVTGLISLGFVGSGTLNIHDGGLSSRQPA